MCVPAADPDNPIQVAVHTSVFDADQKGTGTLLPFVLYECRGLCTEPEASDPHTLIDRPCAESPRQIGCRCFGLCRAEVL